LPAEDTSLTERVLRRDRWVVAAGLAAITALSWAYIMAGAGMGMPAWHMISASLFPHRMAGMPAPMEGMGLHPAHGSPGYWLVVLAMWWTMMIAMMTPSAAPMILLYARATRHAQASGRLQQGVVPTAAFGGGYLLVWLAFSVAATALMWAMEGIGALSAATMGSSAAWASAALLIAAGVYQLSPLKHACLRVCRAPAEFLSRHWRPGSSGALRMGLAHGVFCVGCCWALMALLFVGGIMNVLWIAALAILVLFEKVAPQGAWISRATGVLLLAWGAMTLAV
jgi:predicted metal-binding membrane protein